MAVDQPRISLCMIVRDEEEKLPRCLAAAAPHVQEIVVVDTGSKDRTREIARAAGARVIEHPWADDFAAARNRSMAEARGAWLLFLDADEVLTPEAGRDLATIAARRDTAGVYFPLRDQGDGGKEMVTMMFRAVRRRPEYRWRYRIHEQILPDVLVQVRRRGGLLVEAAGEILHDGYRAEVMAAKDKRRRNRRLYEAQLGETPDDVYILYKYADFLRKDGTDAALAPAQLERAWDALRRMPERDRRDLTFGGELCALLGLARDQRGAPAEALEAAAFGVSSCRPSANLHYVHGVALLRLGRAAEAEAAFRACRALHGRPALIPAQPQITGTGARLGLARALALQKRWREAADTAWEAAEAEPANVEALETWTAIETGGGDWQRAAARFIARAQAHPACGTTWFRGGELWFRLRLFDKALPWLARATELAPDRAPAQALLGETLLHLGHFEAACDAFLRGRPDLRCRAGILVLTFAFGIEGGDAGDRTDAGVLVEARRIVENLRAAGDTRLIPRLRDVFPAALAADPEAARALEPALG